MKAVLIAATALTFSAGVASAQAVYVAPGYAPAYVAPTYVAPAPVYVAPAPVYTAPAATVVVPRRVVRAAPVYDYAPGPVTVVEPGW
jgi:hypothetical protein